MKSKRSVLRAAQLCAVISLAQFSLVSGATTNSPTKPTSGVALPSSAKAPPPPPAPAARGTPNQLFSAKLTSAQMVASGDLGQGNILGFQIKGVGDAKPSCVVRMRFDRAPNLIHPMPYGLSKDVTLSDMSTIQLESGWSPQQGGDWVFQLSTLQNCSGGPFAFARKVKFTDEELDPKIVGMSAPGESPPFTHGTTRFITITGKGDLKNCQVELNINAPVLNAGKRIIALNGAVTFKEPVIAQYPASDKPGGPAAWSYANSTVELKTLSGCTLQNPGSENKLKDWFKVWAQ